MALKQPYFFLPPPNKTTTLSLSLKSPLHLLFPSSSSSIMPIENNPSFFNGFPSHLPSSSNLEQPSNSLNSLFPSTNYMSSPIIHEIINYKHTFPLLPNSYNEYNNILKPSFQCRICSMKFPTAQAYGGHMSYHSKLKKAQERKREEAKNEEMNAIIKGKKRQRAVGIERRKNFGSGNDESVNSEFYFEECSDCTKKRKLVMDRSG